MAKADELFAKTDLPPIKPGDGLYPLFPLTVWHVWQLQVLQSPYAIGGPITDKDRLQAVLVLSKTRAELLALYDDEARLEAAIFRLQELFDAAPDKEAYRTYVDAHIAACIDWPEYWQDGKSKPLKAPFAWLTVRNLLHMRVCQTEAEAWDYPAARAMCWQAVEIEANGGRDYIGQEERDQFKKAEALCV